MRISGRGWAYIGAGLGGAVSIAANVAHSYVPPAGAAADWAPPTGAVVGAVFWPVSLFVAIEILARVAWPLGRRWTLLRFGGLVPVAAVAAFVSYKHLSGLLTFYGEDTLTATLGPLAVDGLMVMATGALLATRPQHETVTEVVPDTPAVVEVDTAPPVDIEPVPDPWAVHSVPYVPPTPVQVDTPRPPAKKVSRPKVDRPAPVDSNKARVVQAHLDTPDATDKELAERLVVSTKTVQRYRPPKVSKPAGQVDSPKPINGHVPQLQGVSG